MSTEVYDETPPPPETPFAEAMEEFDKLQLDFFEVCKTYRRLPLTKNREEVYKTSEKAADAWTDVLASIITDDEIDTDEKIKMIITLIKGSESRREYFKKLFDCKDEKLFKTPERPRVNYQEFLAYFDDEEFDSEELIDDVTAGYTEELETDVMQLINKIDSLPKARIITTSQLIGHHALDVAKISAGVWLGLRLSRNQKTK